MDEYLSSLKDRGLMSSTLVTYRSELQHFVRWAESSQKHTVRRLDVGSYVLHLREIQYRLHGRVSTLRGFCRWLFSKGHTSINPLEHISLRSQPRSLPSPVITADEVKKVLESIPETPLGIRDRAMLEVLFSSGLRRSELMRLTLRDVDVQRGVLFIRQGKGQKDRIVPIGESALYWLDIYIREVRPESSHPNIFLSREKNPISPAMVLMRCKKWVAEAGITKAGNTHAWRHAAATALLEGGAGLRHVQAFLGHEHIGTTVIYTKVSVKKLREVHRRTHPFEMGNPDG